MSGEENSPLTSPIHRRSPPDLSPATSPLRISPASRSAAGSLSGNESSSPNVSPIKISKKRNVCRTTIQRKRRRLEQLDYDSSDGDSIINEETNQPQNLVPSGKPLTRNAEDHFQCEDSSPERRRSGSSDTDPTSEDSGQSESCSSDSDSSECSSVAYSSASCAESDNCGSGSGRQSEESADTVQELYEGSEISVNESLLRVLKLYVEEHWTKTSLDKNIKLIKKLLPKPNEFPSSGKAALKKLEELTSACVESEYLYCGECLQLVDNDGGPCHHNACQSKFFSFPIDDQIRHMFEQRGLAAAIDSYRDHESKKAGYVCDIVDGAEFKTVKERLCGIYDLVLLWNTDGVALSSSSNVELWPILCIISEVPPRLRASFVIVAGVYVGSKAPDMNVFLKPFVDSLKNLFENGVEWVHPVSKETFISKIAAPLVSVDAPAKAHIQNCKNHNARYGCLICEQKSKKIQIRIDAPAVNNPEKRPRRIRRFVYQDDVQPAQLRTGPRMNLLGTLAKAREKSRKGVLGDSVISEIPLSDRALCLSAEYMHLILLGVVKYFLLIIFTKAGPWSLANKVEEINSFIMHDIKVPDFVSRLPRKVKDLKYWKASELRSFLLYYSLPIFKQFEFSHNYYQHWLLLVGATHILLKDAISEADLNSADIMFRAFVRDIGELYGEACYTYNVHNLLHVCLLVRRWGPLWATSAFIFESFNGFLGSNVHGTKNLGQELISNIKISQSVAILENIVNAPRRAPPQHQLYEVLGKQRQRLILSNEEQREIDSSGHFGAYVLHVRAKFKTRILTSRIYDSDKKRANSFVQVNGQEYQYGQIVVFLKTENGAVHCLIEGFKVVQVNLLFHEASRYIVRNILPVESSNSLLVIPIDCIETKVLKVGNYIALRPNSYEVNL